MANKQYTEQDELMIYSYWRATGCTLKVLSEKWNNIQTNTISAIISRQHKQNRKRVLVDSELEKCATIECHLGIDSTRKELIHAKWQQRKHLKNIKEIDKDFFIIIEPDNDKP